MHTFSTFSRRQFVGGLAGVSVFSLAGGLPGVARAAAKGTKIHTRPIPATGERIPAIGMGTWVTFNVGADPALRDHCARIMKIFFERGGALIDCSPMYGSSADVIGHGLRQLENTGALFSASKVWTWGADAGREQMAEQRERWGVERFDLMQVHNLRSWKEHLKTLREMKDAGQIRYIGVTTSHGSRHEALEQVMRTQPLDFVQFSYNILDREAEARLLPLAREKGIAVIANRPFRHKELFRMFQDKPLPAWAAEEAGAKTWAEFFLKFIISHPAVTCAIPATSQIPHIRENMAALKGSLPAAGTRRRMIDYVEAM